MNALRAHLTLGGLISLEGSVVSELAGEQVPLPCAVVCPQRRHTLASGLASEAGCVAAMSSLLSWGPLWYFMCCVSIKTLSGLQGRAWLVGFLFKFGCESALVIGGGGPGCHMPLRSAWLLAPVFLQPATVGLLPASRRFLSSSKTDTLVAVVQELRGSAETSDFGSPGFSPHAL